MLEKRFDFYTVTSLNRLIKSKLDSDANLKGIRLKGEISNFKRHSSGHFYFSLKDSECVISAIMFADNVQNTNFNPKDGDEVLVFGSISSFPQRGQYQIYVMAMELFGQGALLLELEKLKQKLQKEGLFDESKKRPLKRYPSVVGVISARGSAAIEDIIKNISRRNPSVQIIVFPSQVQGQGAEKDLLRAFSLAMTYELDTLIIGRGGGSSEDLKAFNDETLVRAVSKSRIPVISAVGHEIDTTLIDYVSDKRASTPTGAAELAVADKNDILGILAYYSDKNSEIINSRIANYKSQISFYKTRPVYASPLSIHDGIKNKLAIAKERLISFSPTKRLDTYRANLRLYTSRPIYYKVGLLLEPKSAKIKSLKERLNALSPYSILKRGYSILQSESGDLIKSVNEVQVNQKVKTITQDGIINLIVTSKEENDNGKTN